MSTQTIIAQPRPKWQPAPPTLTPGERADVLAKQGYTLQRTDTLGIYWLTKPDCSRRYRVDAVNDHCDCPASQLCKHIIFCWWYWAYDRARQQLTEAYRADLLVHAHEDSFYAAACDLMAITGADMWDEMRAWQTGAQGRGAVAERRVAA